MSFNQFENDGFDLTIEHDNGKPPDSEANGAVAESNNGFVNRLADFDVSEPTVVTNVAPKVSRTPNYDQIEVEIIGGVKEVTKEDPLVNASDFFLEHNENYQLSWEEASMRVTDGGAGVLDEDPSKPPTKGWNEPYIKWKTRRIIESIWFRILTFVLIVVDITIVLFEVLESGEGHNYAFLYLDLVITVYFVFEIALRIWTLGREVFFTEWFNVVDFAVVIITLITAVCVVAAASGAEWASKVAVIVVLRFVRFVRLFRICTERKQVEISIRQLVSQNKRRYQQDGYDLDLTYVTKRVIATSFPSTGVWALYRNPIGHVAAFLNDKHKEHYKMYNLCSERTYDSALFGGEDVVQRYMIDDHNVPSLSEMVRFSQDVERVARKKF